MTGIAVLVAWWASGISEREELMFMTWFITVTGLLAGAGAWLLLVYASVKPPRRRRRRRR